MSEWKRTHNKIASERSRHTKTPDGNGKKISEEKRASVWIIVTRIFSTESYEETPLSAMDGVYSPSDSSALILIGTEFSVNVLYFIPKIIIKEGMQVTISSEK